MKMNESAYELGDRVYFKDEDGNICAGIIIMINAYKPDKNGSPDIDHPYDFEVEILDGTRRHINKNQIIRK